MFFKSNQLIASIVNFFAEFDRYSVKWVALALDEIFPFA